MAATWTILAGVIGVIALSIYLFGIPPEMKRKMERQALKTMGENKMSYMVKGTPQLLCTCKTSTDPPPDQISKVPASDQEDVKNLKQGLGNAAGGLMSNPIGEATGETADRLTSPLTGR
jgi:hypothetical protein